MVVLLLILLGGIVHLILLRQQVFGDPREADPRHADPSVQAALQARQKRSEARQLAANDPLMAREVRIGGPTSSAPTTTAAWSTSTALPHR